jgi:hypothetical protein
MSGFWSIERIENYEELWVEQPPSSPGLVPSREGPDGRILWLDPVTATLLWYLPFAHVEEITEENIEDTFMRVRMWELAQGTIFRAGGEPAFIELDDLRRRIGLRVGAGIPLAPFEEALIRALRYRAHEDLNNARKPV